MARSITDIQADLTAAYAARRAALTDPEEFSLDTGQGRMSGKRSLPNIEQTIRNLEAELASAESGGVSPSFVFERRY